MMRLTKPKATNHSAVYGYEGIWTITCTYHKCPDQGYEGLKSRVCTSGGDTSCPPCPPPGYC